jgi:sugar phosphate isomerase/epimerase
MQTAAAMGATGVELDLRNEVSAEDLSQTGRRQFTHFLGEHGLSVAAGTFPLRSSLADPDRLDARLEAVKRAMEFAYQLGAKVLTVRLGRVPNDPASTVHQSLLEILDDLAGHGNRVGTTLALTPARDSAETLKTLVDTVTGGPLGVHLDPAVFVLGGHDPTAAFRILHPTVLHVQLRDAVRDVDGGGVEVPVGRGEVAWDELLALFDESGYRGWLTAERTAGNDRAGDLERAMKYVRNVALG